MGMSGFERELSRKATRRERRPAGNENLVISNKYHAVAGQSAAAAANPVEVDKTRLKEQALKSDAVQAMLDVFAVKVTDAEEIS